MPEPDYNPSGYELFRADVTSHAGVVTNFRDIITAFEISQSLEGSYLGVISVLDNVNQLEGLPLRAEEKLDLQFKMRDTGDLIELKAQIWKIDSITPSKTSNGVTYLMHFMSRTSYKGSLKRVRKSFKNKSVNQIVESIWEDYVSSLGEASYQDDNNRSRTLSYATQKYTMNDDNERSLYIQPSEGVLDVIIPNMIPEDAMKFLKKRAMNTDTPSHTFRFFETIYNYYFVSDEFLIKEGIELANNNEQKELFYAPNASNLPTEPVQQVNRIDKLTINSRGTDSGSAMLGGAYSIKTIEIDIVKGVVNRKWWNYATDAKFLDMSGQQASIERLPHSSAYITETFTEENAKTFVVLKDTQQPADRPSSLRNDANNAEIVAMRNFYNRHLSETSLAITLKGRIDLVPGVIINLKIPAFSSAENTEDNRLAGNYLIKSTTHTFKGDSVSTMMNIVKFGWS